MRGMRRWVLGVAMVGGSGLAVPASAQQPPPLVPGTPVVQRLTATDPSIAGRGSFHVYRLTVRADRRYVIRMASAEFDTYLWVARRVGLLTDEIASNDDASGGASATDSRLTFRPDESGEVLVVAQSYGNDGVGTYTLSVEEMESAPAPTPRQLAVGDTVGGRLDESSPVLEDDDDVPYQLYTLRLTSAARVRVAMVSDDFDTFLRVLRGGAEVASDDDGFGGSNARVYLSEPGEYTIQARAYGSSAAGAYLLHVTEVPMPRLARFPIVAGDTVSRALGENDAEAPGGQFMQEYVLTAVAGARYRIELRSSTFDTYLQWGRADGESFQELAADDDGLSGTDSMLEVRADRAGEYRIRVRPLSAGSSGSYVLSVTRLP